MGDAVGIPSVVRKSLKRSINNLLIMSDNIGINLSCLKTIISQCTNIYCDITSGEECLSIKLYLLLFCM